MDLSAEDVWPTVINASSILALEIFFLDLLGFVFMAGSVCPSVSAAAARGHVIV
jgi:hypothetical protein